MVTPQGHEVIEAKDGAEGVALAREQFDLVLLDLIMPQMDGFAVLEVLHRELPQLPIVILTADIQEATRRQCIALGARGFLNKPPQRDALLSLLQELLGS
ncbi:Transcriptional regulatory protein GlrR [anaerobic digester metagenome]